MQTRHLEIPGPIEIVPAKHGDDRGFFSETFNSASLGQHGIHETWVQDNHAVSYEAGVLRGLHYQLPPHAQAKLIRVSRGAIFDVVVDIRTGSPTFGRWVGVELSVAAWNQLYVPVGFAHGYLTLSSNTEVLYKVSSSYAPQSEGSIRFDDPDIQIDWPGDCEGFVLSNKDRNAGALSDSANVFEWREQ
jgi:dTDP-4-dehydrorhamnose 3,5-epimerase|tara:strand:- start:11215 stop:11781 length:567 start_codon:yes stop_codon:yes gene_type:complete